MKILTPAPALPSIPFVRLATPADAPVLARWLRDGIAYRRNRIARLAILAAGTLLLPAEILRLRLVLATGIETIALYCPAGDDQPIACVGVQRFARCWFLLDHVAAAPGHGHGAALRHLVAPALAAQADAEHVTIKTVAVNMDLGRAYAGSLPGLTDRGFGFPRGRRMRRDPI
ncbi:hypothetical protein [Cellulosimicrobium sp. Marseille-Q4280]|uniref:hypothetical protein n=1 Tax=Cellulosimicrobium sp. Marseille-Q4280 TaxID=2937992 RepID=UPI00203A679F|nr:hypothetical protein [Cellulosimicrobium sp. Marseille-Q4280]